MIIVFSPFLVKNVNNVFMKFTTKTLQTKVRAISYHRSIYTGLETWKKDSDMQDISSHLSQTQTQLHLGIVPTSWYISDGRHDGSWHSSRRHFELGSFHSRPCTHRCRGIAVLSTDLTENICTSMYHWFKCVTVFSSYICTSKIHFSGIYYLYSNKKITSATVVTKFFKLRKTCFQIGQLSYECCRLLLCLSVYIVSASCSMVISHNHIYPLEILKLFRSSTVVQAPS